MDGGTVTRHLLDIASVDDADIDWILSRAQALVGGAQARLENAVVANLFYEPSTRTRVAFERAAQRSGAAVVNVAAQGTSVTKGESLADTARTLAALGVNIIVLRHPENGASLELAGALPAGVHLVNAGDGTRAHPTQALLDVFTLRRAGLEAERARIAIIGDLRHSRVARSGIELLKRLGVAEIRIAGPKAWLPDDGQFSHLKVCESFEDAAAGADVIMMLRIQRERMRAGDPGSASGTGFPDPASYYARWGLTPERLALANSDCRVMHPGPMNRGVEIASEVADGPRSLIWQQVANGLPVRMAVFEWLFRE